MGESCVVTSLCRRDENRKQEQQLTKEASPQAQRHPGKKNPTAEAVRFNPDKKTMTRCWSCHHPLLQLFPLG